MKNENRLRIPMMAAEMAVMGASPDGDLWCVFCVCLGGEILEVVNMSKGRSLTTPSLKLNAPEK